MPQTTTTPTNRDRFLAGEKFGIANELPQLKIFRYNSLDDDLIRYICLDDRWYCKVDSVAADHVAVSGNIFFCDIRTTVPFSLMIF